MWLETVKITIEVFHYGKLIMFALISIFAGGTFAEMFSFIFQAAEVATSNYTTPILGGIGGIVVYIATKYFDDYLARRREREKEEKAEESQHITLSEKIQELQFKRDQNLIEEIKEFCEAKLRFKDEQIIEAQVGEYYGRERAHAYGGYTQSVQSYVQILEAELKRLGVTPPYEFKLKSHSEIMDGIEEKTLEYKTRLKEDLRIKYVERAEKESKQ